MKTLKAHRRLGLFGLALGLIVSSTQVFAQTTYVSLTFDDGLLSATTAQNVLDAHGMKGTFFIISQLMGSDPTFYIDSSTVKAIAMDGHEIGGHTETHPDLTTLTAAQQQTEICGGRKELIADGFSPISFAYPYGNATSVTTGIVQACGYKSGRGAWCNTSQYSTPNFDGPDTPGTCVESIPPGADGVLLGDTVDDNGDGPYWVNTEEAVSSNTTLGDLETYVTNAENGQNSPNYEPNNGYPVPNPGWVILQFHFICGDNDPTCGEGGGVAEQYGITISTFTAFMDWLQGEAAGGRVVVQPMGQVDGGLPVSPIPVINSVSPSSGTVGVSASTLTLTGINFISTSTVQWNGSPVTSTFVNSTTLDALIPATDLTAVSVATITVSNGGSATSPDFLYSVVNPVPVLTTLSSTFTVVESTGVLVTATGSNFVPTSAVRWNGASLATTYISSSTLTATIPGSDLTTVKIDSVTVFNAAPGGGTSSILPFTVGNPIPVPASLSPNFATVDTTSTITMTVTGSNFVTGSIVLWNGSPLATVGTPTSTSISATVPAGDLTQVGIDTITISNPAPGGGISATGKTFTVGNPVPVLSVLSSSATPVGSPTFSLTVTGSNFIPGSVLQWNASATSTTFNTSTTLSALIPASDLTVPGTFPITIFNPALGGGTSNALSFTVGFPPAPALASIDPTFVTAGGPSFTLTATGNFANGSFLEWNGSPLTMISANSTTLSATVPSSDILVAGNASITVFTPAPGGGTSGTITFIINAAGGSGGAAAVPTLTSLSPDSKPAGSDSFPLTLIGTDFSSASTALWNGSPLVTQFMNSTTLTATVPASDLITVETANVTVATSGSPTTSAQSFTVGGAGQARVFPNPWRVDLHANLDITFDNLPQGSTVKIFTVSAHWVRTLDAPDGFVKWDLKTDGGNPVASGYYVYLITDNSGDKIRGVIGIIR